MKLKMLAVIVGLLVVIRMASTAVAATPTTAPSNSSVVVLMSIDGLAGFYLDDPKAEMPTIRQLVAEGARADSMKAVSPSVTWPNHTTLVTGDFPARHSISSAAMTRSSRWPMRPDPIREAGRC